MRPTALILAALAAPVAAQAPELPADFDAYVAGVMADHEVPGLAIAVVQDGRVILAKGYGVRALGANDRVDEHTLFGIASNTKAFTATALALLVEEGKLGWEDPVIEHLPWFRLSDAWVTSQLTIRDLLVHRSGLGLGAGDLLWWPSSTYTRREVAERLRFLPLVTSFRSAYAYDNVLYTVAGEVIEAVSGMSWEAVVQQRILDPVGMTDSRIRHPGIMGTPNISGTHARVEGTVRAITPFTSDNTNPAGGITASATDMAKWLQVQLDSGRVAGATRLFRPTTTRELWRIVTPQPEVVAPPLLAPLATPIRGYALGFEVRLYRGQQVVTHTGGLPGFISRVAMLPGKRLGIAVMTNMESPAMEPITWRIVDHVLGANHDWRSAYATLAKVQADQIAAARRGASAARDSTAGPALPLASYAGAYRDAWYGGIDIAAEPSGLVIRFGHTPSLVGDLVPWQYETFLVRWRDRELRADAFITFTLDPTGKVAEARMAPASPDVDFSYDFQDLRLVPVRR
ncbi:MAG: serine hydrolase [Gemmatimonadetes bacterium]|nr:serine hydrolase [Gemmatimonadota bacterium]